MLELPQKELLRVDECSAYFSVSERTIRLWAEHGHLEAVKIVGSIRITRESALNCRFGVKPMAEDPEREPGAELVTEKPEPPEEMIPARRGRPPRVKMEE